MRLVATPRRSPARARRRVAERHSAARPQVRPCRPGRPRWPPWCCRRTAARGQTETISIPGEQVGDVGAVHRDPATADTRRRRRSGRRPYHHRPRAYARPSAAIPRRPHTATAKHSGRYASPGLDRRVAEAPSACTASGRRRSSGTRRWRSAGWRPAKPRPLILKIESGASGLRWRSSLTTNAAHQRQRCGEPADCPDLTPARRRLHQRAATRARISTRRQPPPSASRSANAARGGARRRSAE